LLFTACLTSTVSWLRSSSCWVSMWPWPSAITAVTTALAISSVCACISIVPGWDWWSRAWLAWCFASIRSNHWPGLTILFPAWWRGLQLIWAWSQLLVLNLRIVPHKALEVAAAILQSLICKFATVTVFTWVLAVDHPPSTWLITLKTWVRLGSFVTSVALWHWRVIVAWSSNVKMSLARATWIGWWAVVGTLEDDYALLGVSSNICRSSHFETLSTSFSHPAVTTKLLGNGGRSVELSTILITRWSSKHSVWMAMDWHLGVSETASAWATTTVPVSGCRGRATHEAIGTIGKCEQSKTFVHIFLNFKY